MLPPRETWQLDTRRLGRRVLVFDRVESTNTLAMELAGRADTDGLALLADEQAAGRGQHGRRWVAPPRSSVLLSLLLYPPPEADRPALLTAWAAVAVCEVAGRLTGLAPRIKWPNDVLLGDRKVAGILIEQCRQRELAATVVGVGLNVTQAEADFAAAGLPEATSLAAMGAGGQDSHAVARLLLGVLDEKYDRLCLGDAGPLEALWRGHLGLLGEQVVAECLDGEHAGRLVECNFSGLILEQPGHQRVLLPEAVLHIRRR
jgi:BirA family biotin operon repressor/biotin-[acetyl-CoA-carboxylase] ligase